jgi:hypothetical protein
MTETAEAQALAHYTRRTLAGTPAKKPSQIRESQGLCIMVMGPSNAGKTTLLQTLTENENYCPVAVLDVDGKAHVLKDSPHIDIYDAKTWDRIHKFEQQLLANPAPYKVVAWDGTALLQTQTQTHAGVPTQVNAMLRQSAYGRANVELLSIAQNAKILAERGLTVIFNIWSERELEEDTGITHIQPVLTGAMLTKFIGLMDLVMYLEPAPPPKPYPPILRTGGSQKYSTNTAVSPDSELHKMPDLVYQPSLSSILDAYHGAPWPATRHLKGGVQAKQAQAQ